MVWPMNGIMIPKSGIDWGHSSDWFADLILMVSLLLAMLTSPWQMPRSIHAFFAPSFEKCMRMTWSYQGLTRFSQRYTKSMAITWSRWQRKLFTKMPGQSAGFFTTWRVSSIGQPIPRTAPTLYLKSLLRVELWHDWWVISGSFPFSLLQVIFSHFPSLTAQCRRIPRSAACSVNSLAWTCRKRVLMVAFMGFAPSTTTGLWMDPFESNNLQTPVENQAASKIHKQKIRLYIHIAMHTSVSCSKHISFKDRVACLYIN